LPAFQRLSTCRLDAGPVSLFAAPASVDAGQYTPLRGLKTGQARSVNNLRLSGRGGPEMVFLANLGVNLPVCLCGDHQAASSQPTDFLDIGRKSSFPAWKLFRFQSLISGWSPARAGPSVPGAAQDIKYIDIRLKFHKNLISKSCPDSGNCRSFDDACRVRPGIRSLRAGSSSPNSPMDQNSSQARANLLPGLSFPEGEERHLFPRRDQTRPALEYNRLFREKPDVHFHTDVVDTQGVFP